MWVDRWFSIPRSHPETEMSLPTLLDLTCNLTCNFPVSCHQDREAKKICKTLF